MVTLPPHVLLHLARDTRRPVNVEEIFHLEAVGGNTKIRLKGKRRLLDVRTFGALFKQLQPHGFARIHRSHAVNIRRVFEIRRRDDGKDWELRLEPPAQTVLPISRTYLDGLWKAYGN